VQQSLGKIVESPDDDLVGLYFDAMNVNAIISKVIVNPEMENEKLSKN